VYYGPKHGAVRRDLPGGTGRPHMRSAPRSREANHKPMKSTPQPGMKQDQNPEGWQCWPPTFRYVTIQFVLVVSSPPQPKSVASSSEGNQPGDDSARPPVATAG
jgi:hypothetical protein